MKVEFHSRALSSIAVPLMLCRGHCSSTHRSSLPHLCEGKGRLSSYSRLGDCFSTSRWRPQSSSRSCFDWVLFLCCCFFVFFKGFWNPCIYRENVHLFCRIQFNNFIDMIESWLTSFFFFLWNKFGFRLHDKEKYTGLLRSTGLEMI